MALIFLALWSFTSCGCKSVLIQKLKRITLLMSRASIFFSTLPPNFHYFFLKFWSLSSQIHRLTCYFCIFFPCSTVWKLPSASNPKVIVYFSSIWNHNLVLPVFQCLKKMWFHIFFWSQNSKHFYKSRSLFSHCSFFLPFRMHDSCVLEALTLVKI